MSLAELEIKENRVRTMMAQKGLDALLVRGVSNFAWLTDGAANYVSINSAEGNTWLLLTPKAKYVICNNIEATRLQAEEDLESQGCTYEITPWYMAEDTVGRLTQGMTLGADGVYLDAENVSGDLAEQRARLLPDEQNLLRRIAIRTGEAMQAAVLQAEAGMTEHQLAGILAQEVRGRGMTPIVDLVGTDQRIWDHRHPLPTDKALERYAMLVVGARYRGLVAAVTRQVHIGPLPDEVRRRQEAVAQVDAALIAATRPGTAVKEIFERAVEAYANVGFPDEWKHHHQGGAIGYEAREYKANPNSTETVELGQAFAWNPSIAGAKSEDTILVTEKGNEILTAVGDWPTIPVEINGEIIHRPGIKEIS